MMKRIVLTDFKAHEHLDIADIPEIAVIVGRNNTGKSAILQAAALPRFGPRDDPVLPTGAANEVVREGASEAIVECFFEGIANPFQMRMRRGGPPFHGGGWRGNPPSAEDDPLSKIFYISTVRENARFFGYDRFVPEVGWKGENTWNILHQLHANRNPMFDEIEEWTMRMGLGITRILTPTAHPGAGQVIMDSYGGKQSLFLHGSGAHSVLPIIVQGLLSKPGSTVLLEEPESHLHRGAIDGLMKFFGSCAKRGVQMISTTHSLDMLVSLNHRISNGEVSENAAIIHVKRDGNGKTSTDRLDPGVFRGIGEVVKADLGGLPYP